MKSYTLSSYHIFLQFPKSQRKKSHHLSQTFFANIGTAIKHIFVVKNHWGSENPSIPSTYRSPPRTWSWSPFDKGPALSITTLRCLRGAVVHTRRGRSIDPRAWPRPVDFRHGLAPVGFDTAPVAPPKEVTPGDSSLTSHNLS